MSTPPRRRVSMSPWPQVLVAAVDDTPSVMPDPDLEPAMRLQACQSLTAACVAYHGSPHETDGPVRSRTPHRARQACVVIDRRRLSG
jgi:hypothetical protein